MRGGSLWITMVAAALWLIAMVFFPVSQVISLVPPHFDWQRLQAVWYHWQPLNTGVLAAVSGWFLWRAATEKEQRQRERFFRAALASLPQTLKKITRYLELCGKCIREKDSEAPKLDLEIIDRIQECIRYADTANASHLSLLLSSLQVQASRLEKFPQHLTEVLIEIEKIYRVYDVLELLVLVTRLWKLARYDKLVGLETAVESGAYTFKEFESAAKFCPSS